MIYYYCFQCYLLCLIQSCDSLEIKIIDLLTIIKTSCSKEKGEAAFQTLYFIMSSVVQQPEKDKYHVISIFKQDLPRESCAPELQ